MHIFSNLTAVHVSCERFRGASTGFAGAAKFQADFILFALMIFFGNIYPKRFSLKNVLQQSCQVNLCNSAFFCCCCFDYETLLSNQCINLILQDKFFCACKVLNSALKAGNIHNSRLKSGLLQRVHLARWPWLNKLDVVLG